MSHSAVTTIPRKVTKGEELIVMPRKEYEGLLHFYNAQHTVKEKTVKRKADGKLTKGLREALADVKAGRISKAYDNAEDLVAAILSES
jgi:hypothetical protein